MCMVFKISPHKRHVVLDWVKNIQATKQLIIQSPKSYTSSMDETVFLPLPLKFKKKKKVKFVLCTILHLVSKNKMGPVFFVRLTECCTSIFMSRNRTLCISLLMSAKQLQVCL